MIIHKMCYSFNRYLMSTCHLPNTIHMYLTKWPKIENYGIRSEGTHHFILGNCTESREILKS